MEFKPPFTHGEGLIRFLKGTVARGKDIMLCNEGPEGSGKSTTGANIAKAVKPDFDMVEDTIKDLDHLLQVMGEAKMNQVYVLDESINIFHNQDWASWESKMLSKVIRQMRIMRSMWILNQPDYDGLHAYVRENRIPIRIFHPPVYDADGMSNGPSQVYFKHRWFSFKEQMVVSRWQCVIEELHVPCLDETKNWKEYEQDKIQNFVRLIEQIQARRQADQQKARKKRGGA